MSEENQQIKDSVDIEEIGEVDSADGLLHKKKNKKSKVELDPDTVTPEEEEKQTLQRLLELETELLEEKSSKVDAEAEVFGLKTELSVLEKNYKELQEQSKESLEEFQKFELEKLNGQMNELEKERQSLAIELKTAITRTNSDANEIEGLKKVIEVKDEEIKDFKSKLIDLEDKHQTTLKTSSSTKESYEKLIEEAAKSTEQHEQTEKNLQEKLLAEESKFNDESEKLNKENEEIKKREDVSKTEIEFLKVEMAKVVQEKQKEKQNRLKTSERLKLFIDEKNRMETQYKVDLELIQTDFQIVKEHLVGITNEKANIWNRLNDHLSQKRSERWVKDEETINCTNCNGAFTMTLRRHHCRICGHIFCYKCSNRWLLTPHNKKRIRSCDLCAEAYTELHGTAENVDSVDGVCEKLQRYIELKGEEINKYEAEPLEDGKIEQD